LVSIIWVYGVEDRAAYLAKLEAEDSAIWERLSPGEALSQPINYGAYT